MDQALPLETTHGILWNTSHLTLQTEKNKDPTERYLN